MLLEDTNIYPDHHGLTEIKGGKILILGDNPATALLIKQTFNAELVTPGSAVGGSFDREVTEFYIIGNVTFNVPSDSIDRQRAIEQRQGDMDRMLLFWQEQDTLLRSTSFLKMLCQKFGFNEARNIPIDFLVCLTGTNPPTISQAWERLLRFDAQDDLAIATARSDFHPPTLSPQIDPKPIDPQEMFVASDLSGYHSTSLQLDSAIKTPQRRGLNWRLLFAVGSIALAGVGLLWCVLSQSVAPRPINPAANTGSNTKQPQLIAAMGYVEPQGEIILLSAPALMEGSRIEKLLIRQGDAIRKGQVVALLDNRDRLQAVLAQAQQSVKVAEAKLQQVKAGSKKGDIQAQDAKYRRSKAELQGQISTQQATIGNIQAQLEGERSTQESLILQTKAELDHATKECARYAELERGGAISKSQRDNICLTKSTAQERLAQANTSLSRIVNTRQQQIREAKSNLQRVIDTLNNEIAATAATKDAVSEVRPVDVQVATQEVISSQVAVNKARTDLAQASVRAPINGRVLKIKAWPGELLGQQKGIAELGNTTQMYVSADIYETDIARIQPGQTATIRADRTIDTLTGVVDRVGLKIGTPNTLGTDPVKDADVRVVQVKIRLHPADSKKVSNLTNLQVNVVINTGR
jgi:HlyD family secretion protein